MKILTLIYLVLFYCQISLAAESPCLESKSIFQKASEQLKRLEEYFIPSLKYQPEDIAKFVQGEFKFSKSFLHQKLKSAKSYLGYGDLKFSQKLKNFELNEIKPQLLEYKEKLLEYLKTLEQSAKRNSSIASQTIIKKTTQEIDSLLESGNITYFDFLDISAKTIVSIDETIGPAQYPIVLKNFRNDLFLQYQTAANKGGIIWPTSKILKVDDFIDTADGLVYFIGVVYKTESADGKIYSPLRFANHDIAHMKIITLRNRMIPGHSEKFINNFRKKVALLPNEQSELFKIFFFQFIHEITPKERDMYEFYLTTLFKKYLNDPTVLEKTVRLNYSKTISRQKLKEEIDNFIEFIDNLR